RRREEAHPGAVDCEGVDCEPGGHLDRHSEAPITLPRAVVARAVVVRWRDDAPGTGIPGHGSALRRRDGPALVMVRRRLRMDSRLGLRASPLTFEREDRETEQESTARSTQ